MAGKNTKPYIIVLDDDSMVPKLIEKMTGINCLHFTTTKAIIARSQRYKPIAAFIDIHLDADDCGLNTIPTLRTAWPSTPIIVVTGDESDEAVGQALAIGANDFIKKPVKKGELKARLKARMAELSEKAATTTIQLYDILYEYRHGILRSGEQFRHLSPTEKKIMETLIAAKGMVVTRKELKSSAWGNVRVSDNALDKKIFDLRASVKELTDKVVIKSVYGVGLQLEF